MLMRLDKFIAAAEPLSRAEVKQLLRQGRVAVDGAVVTRGETKLDPETARVCLDGRDLAWAAHHYYMMNKPAGVLSATEDGAGKTVLDLMGEAERRFGLFPAGRLDKDAEGLLILTDDGDFCHRLISPKSGVEKTYYAETAAPVPAAAPAAFATGLTLADGTRCLPAKLEILGENRARVSVCEGKYHQVRRMLAAVGKPVKTLRRISVGPLQLEPGPEEGCYRELTDEELCILFNMLGMEK